MTEQNSTDTSIDLAALAEIASDLETEGLFSTADKLREIIALARRTTDKAACSPNCFWGDCPPCVEAGVAPPQAGTGDADERTIPKRWQDRLPKGASLSYDYAHVSAMKREIEEWRALSQHPKEGALREAVRAITLLLQEREWADVLNMDADAIALWDAVDKLVAERAALAQQAAAKRVATVRVTNAGYGMELSTYIAYALPEGMHDLYAAPARADEAGDAKDSALIADTTRQMVRLLDMASTSARESSDKPMVGMLDTLKCLAQVIDRAAMAAPTEQMPDWQKGGAE